MQKLTSLPSTRKLRSYRTFKTDQNIPDDTPLEIVNQMALIAGISSQNPFEALNELESLLVSNDTGKKEVSVYEPTLDNVLLKMQKFDNC